MKKHSVQKAINLKDLSNAKIITASISEKLQKAGVKNMRDLFKKEVKEKIYAAKISGEDYKKIAGLGKFNLFTENIGLLGRLSKHGFHSFNKLSRIPYKRLEESLGNLDKDEKRNLRRLYFAGRKINFAIQNNGINRKRAASKDGGWYFLDKDWLGKYGAKHKNDGDCTECGCCDNVFSQRAYLYDLLNVVYFYWGIPVEAMEKILLQELTELDCSNLTEPVLQTELAIEVLNKISGIDNYTKELKAFGKAGASIGLTDALFSILGHGQLTQNDRINHSNQLVRDLAAEIYKPQSSLSQIRNIRVLMQPIAAAFTEQQKQIHLDTLINQLLGALTSEFRHYVLNETKISKNLSDADLEWFFIDFTAGEGEITTRVTQLINSVQSFILSIRTGDIQEFSRKDLAGEKFVMDVGISNIKEYTKYIPTLPAYSLDNVAWKWLSDYTKWASSMYATLFTENVLHPFGKTYSQRFTDTVIKEMSGKIGPLKVRELYKSYLIKTNFESRMATKISPYDMNIIFMRNGYESVSLDTWKKVLDDAAIEYYALPAEPQNPVPLSTKLERDLFFPLLAGWALNRSGYYSDANDWFRMMYDPYKAGNKKFVFDFNTNFNGTELRLDDWYAKDIDAHFLAANRTGVYLRHTIIVMVRNLIDWADHLFAISNPQSVKQAKELYELAEKILSSPDLSNHCFRAIDELIIDVVERVDQVFRAVAPGKYGGHGLRKSLGKLYGIENGAVLQHAIKGIRELSGGFRGKNVDRLTNQINALVDDALIKDGNSGKRTRLGDDFNSRNSYTDDFENNNFGLSSGPGVPQNGGGFVDPMDPFWGGGDKPTGPDDGPGLPGLPGSPGGDRGGIPNSPQEWEDWLREHPEDDNFPIPEPGTDYELHPEPQFLHYTFCIPPNPLLKAIDAYLKSSLLKLNNGLNIAGEPLPVYPITCGTVNDVITTIAQQQGIQANNPDIAYSTYTTYSTEMPRYRFSFLLAKAKEQAEFGQRLGQAFLQAYVGFDNETFQQLTTEQALGVASSTITLKELVRTEAFHGKDLADKQSMSANIKKSYYQELVDGGMMSDNEKLAMNLMIASGVLQGAAAVVTGATLIPAALAAGIGTGVSVAGGAATASVALAEIGIPIAAGGLILVAGGAAALAAAGPILAQTLQGAAATTATFSNVASMQASFERRFTEWNFQNDLAAIDQQIAAIQGTIAQDRINIANQDLEIARLQHANIEEQLEFLRNKFTNDELYYWMKDTLANLYRSVMQIASNTALNAQRALEFERQQKFQIISGDYWTISDPNLSDEQKNAGLLAGEKLLTDLNKLENYKIVTDRRALQISKSISLAQYFPLEFQTFRQTGRFVFNTSMEMFDWDFPGHYLRLIKGIKISVLALAPPVDGIHGALINEGISSVVVRENGEFKKKRAIRNFMERIILDSAINENGLFVFNFDDPMLLPFEGLGVETSWILELPKATNRFNFDTIADIIFTLDYTANAEDMEDLPTSYRQSVIAQLGESLSLVSTIDMAVVFPDSWYELKNHLDSAVDKEVTLHLPRTFFPPQLLHGGNPAKIISVKHLTVVLKGENANGLQGKIKIARPTLPVPNSVTVSTDAHGIFTTITPGSTQNSPTFLPGQTIDSTGDWKITLDKSMYVGIYGERPIDKIDDMVLLISVLGEIDWGVFKTS